MGMEGLPPSVKISIKFLKWPIVIIILYFAICGVVAKFGIDIEDSIASSLSSSDSGDGSLLDLENCNVLGINVHGQVVTYISNDSYNDIGDLMYDLVSADEVAWYIREAEKEDSIKAILVEIDSGGGSPVAGEEMAIAIRSSSKPTVAMIRDIGASAAYWAATGANRIFASKNSDVGSIGVTSSYISNVEKNNKEGLTFEQISSGKFKDSGTADKPLTNEERALFLRDVNIIYENFIEAVSVNRNIPIADVRKIADGSTVLGERAKELRLIDEIGGINEVEKYLSELIGAPAEICWQ